MGGRGSNSSGGGGGGVAAANLGIPNVVATATLAVNANNANFPATDSRGFHDLQGGRAYYQSQTFSIDQQISNMNYLSDTKEAGTLYSMSQNMNHALATGQPLTANQQYVYDNMMSSMHNLGENLNLTRYDHPGLVNQLLADKGVKSTYENLTESQLRSILVGHKYGESKFISTSHNDFAKAPTGARTTFMDRPVKLTYHAKASTQSMMPGNGPGGALGEIVLAPSRGATNFKIVDVKYTGKMARSKQSHVYNMPQVELVVEVE